MSAENEIGKCLECGASVDYTGVDYPENDQYVYEWECPKCKSKGKEYYSMTFIEQVLRD